MYIKQIGSRAKECYDEENIIYELVSYTLSIVGSCTVCILVFVTVDDGMLYSKSIFLHDFDDEWEWID